MSDRLLDKRFEGDVRVRPVRYGPVVGSPSIFSDIFSSFDGLREDGETAHGSSVGLFVDRKTQQTESLIDERENALAHNVVSLSDSQGAGCAVNLGVERGTTAELGSGWILDTRSSCSKAASSLSSSPSFRYVPRRQPAQILPADMSYL